MATLIVTRWLEETLVTDTRVYEVVGATAKTITVRTTVKGDTVRSQNIDGNPYPVVYRAVQSDPRGRTFTLRLRKDGTYRTGRSAHALRAATLIDGVPVAYTDYRY
ncbi:MAG: hypothetical protein ACOYOQ_00415 [Microthrixaceae bacterium]